MAKDQIVDNTDMQFINKANILIEALPYIQKLWGKTIVIKYGGNAMVDPSLTRKILEDVTLLKYVGLNPILVHGGGPEINAMLKRVDVKSEFHNGLRITDDATMEIVQMVLAGKLNKNIAAEIGTLGGKAIGLCGKDAGLIVVKKKPPLPDGVDLGHVGDIVKVNTKLLNTLLGVVLVAIALRLPGSTFIIRNFFNDIPKDIENSALVDGCNRLTAFFQVIIHMVKPGIASISVFAFMSAWSNYLLFNTLILTGKVPIMATYLRSLSMNDQMIADYGVFSAMALVYMLPVFVFFIISQKSLMKGGFSGGKGI